MRGAFTAIALFIVAAIAVSEGGAQSADAWARADSAIVRLMPDRFPALPAAIRADLQRRRCLIPQSSDFFSVEQPSGVIRGAFTGPNRVDWAVLCSVQNVSAILVYGGDNGTATDSLESTPDVNHLQGIGQGRIGYSRAIGVATPATIRRYAAAFPGGVRPPSVLDHDGIDDAFLGKASVIFYFHAGKWLRLQGAD